MRAGLQDGEVFHHDFPDLCVVRVVGKSQDRSVIMVYLGFWQQGFLSGDIFSLIQCLFYQLLWVASLLEEAGHLGSLDVEVIVTAAQASQPAELGKGDGPLSCVGMAGGVE